MVPTGQLCTASRYRTVATAFACAAPAICGELRMRIGTAPDAAGYAPAQTRSNRNEPKERSPDDPEYGDS
jgi:hypothetical protein